MIDRIVGHLGLLAQQGKAAAPAQGAGGEPASNPLFSLIPFLPAILLLYLMIIRPQQVQERERKKMIEALKRNDRVLTAAGIYGTVLTIDPKGERVTLRVDDEKGIKMTFSKSSIVRVEKTAEAETEKAAVAS
jgi:preprotein translocase subunit YajC